MPEPDRTPIQEPGTPPPRPRVPQGGELPHPPGRRPGWVPPEEQPPVECAGFAGAVLTVLDN